MSQDEGRGDLGVISDAILESPRPSWVEQELEYEALMDRFDVGLALVTHGTYASQWDPTVRAVEVSDVLKRELVEALELGVNIPDGEQVRLMLLLSSVRRPA